MNPRLAAELALEALIWLSGEPEALGHFLDASGLAPSDLRARANDADFLGFLLDFLLSDEAMLLAFCAATGHNPADPGRARAALPGGDVPNWT